MDGAAIRRIFSLDRSSQEPLVNQLTRKLEDFVSRSAPGTRLPAERVMAEELGVSRVTVRNALASFFLSGKVIRQRHNGTVVARGKEPDAGKLAIGLPWNAPPPKRKLRFLSYETLPEQMDFWQDAIARFNARQMNLEVELVPMAELPLETLPLREEIERNKIDMLLYSHLFDRNYSELVQPLPESLRNFREEADLIPSISAGREEWYRFLLPVSFEFCHTMWNPELAERLGLTEVEARLKKGEKIKMIAEAAPKLPENVWAGSHVWCQLAYHGVQPFPEKRAILLDELRKLASVSTFPRAYFTSQTSSLDDVEKFAAGEMLFLDAAMTQLQWVGRPAFACRHIPCRQTEGGKLTLSSNNVGIAKRCQLPEAAAEFCRFLLSPEIQKSVETRKMVQPVRMASYIEAMKNQCGFSAEESRNLLESSFFFRDMTHKKELAQYFMIYEIRQELADLFDSKLAPEQAADRIIEKWQAFSAGRLWS